MKAIIEEQEAPSAVRAVPREERRATVANVAVHPEPQAPAVKTPKTEDYPSCLDLAAEFICRG